MPDLTLPALKSARELATTASKPYPNDSAEHLQAATALLAEEIELRRHIERVAAQRRVLPLGGEPPPYDFVDENGGIVGLADLFGKHDTLVTYFWMFGPQRQRPCPPGQRAAAAGQGLQRRRCRRLVLRQAIARIEWHAKAAHRFAAQQGVETKLA